MLLHALIDNVWCAEDEPAAEDPPLIQEPATMEGDELPESSFDKRAYNPNIQVSMPK